MKKCNILIAALLPCVTVVYFFSVIFSTQTFAFSDIYIFFNPRRCLLNVKYLISPFSLSDDDFKLIQDEENDTLIDFKGSAKVLKYTANQVEIETSGNDSGFLVLADNYYPGWKVYVNGIEKKVLRVNYNLRGVIVPRGENKVRFIYDPLSFKIGAAISLLTLLSIIAFFLLRRRVRHIGSC